MLNKDMGSYIFLAAISIKETLLMINDKVTDKCSGMMDLFLRDNGKMVYKMVKAKFI